MKSKLKSIHFKKAFELSQYGTLEALQALISDADIEAPEGKVADYIPELRQANVEDKGISICLSDGQVISAGQADKRFTIQSISKTAALLYALESVGAKRVFSKVGKEPTGDPFNSGLRFQKGSKRPHNPMINAGAIVISSLFPGDDPFSCFSGYMDFLKRLCGNTELEIDNEVYRSEKATGHNNRSLAWIMNDRKVFSYKEGINPTDFVEGILDVYFRQCSVLVSTKDLARFAAMLSKLGLDPVTGARHASEEHVKMVLALMGSCGLYDGSGSFAAKIGIPGKSGVGGGIITAVPGKLGLATYGPGLDPAGNSTFGLYALEKISKEEKLSIFSRPTASVQLKHFNTEAALDSLVEESAEITSGRVADYIPALSEVLPEHRAIAYCTPQAEVFGGGEHSKFSFTLQSVCIPFLLTYILNRRGSDFVFSNVGREPTGDHFDADPKWVKIGDKSRPFNPMMNAGAILIASMMPEHSEKERRESFLEFVRDVCGNPSISLDERVYESERKKGELNRKLAWELLYSNCFTHRQGKMGQSKADFIEEILSDYFFACSLKVSCNDIARFAALLASQGNAPALTKRRISSEHISEVVTLMSTCGLYDGSGEFAFSVGLPSKSGVSGGIMSVVPGKLGIGAFCSAVDPKGASVIGRHLIETFSKAEGLSIYRANK